jgi:LmbE family N-acetylglucosaminyl deacetylase
MPKNSINRVLIIAAHPDDEVLGGGATFARLRAEGADLFVAIVTEGWSVQYPDQPKMQEKKQQAARAALDALGGGELFFGNLANLRLDTLPHTTVNNFIEQVVREVKPDIVFTHQASDLNHDHRIVHQASLVACRPWSSHRISLIYAYPILGVSAFGGTQLEFSPTVFFACEAFLPHKLAALEAYAMEKRPFPHPRSPEAIEAQGRLYGSLCGVNWAEGFVSVRQVY